MYEVRQITRKECIPFIMEIHYARRMPSVSYCFGLYLKESLVGVITYGSPASAPLCSGVAGVENRALVIELNRLVLLNNKKNEASILISRSIKLLPKPLYIVSYADTAQNHLGIVYQASNFLFTGTSKKRTDIFAGIGKHPRHHLGDTSIRIERSPKHRYIYLHGTKNQKKKLLEMLRYDMQPYPKGDIC